MNNEKNFYDILRSKFNDKEHPFDEANWKSMRKMIDDSRADKKRTMWIAASLFFLLFAVGTFAIIEWKTGNGKQNSLANQGVPANNSSESNAGNGKSAANASTSAENSNSKTTNNTISINSATNNNNQTASLNNSSTGTNQTPSNGNNTVASVTPTQHKKSGKAHKHIYPSGGQVVGGSFDTHLTANQLAALNGNKEYKIPQGSSNGITDNLSTRKYEDTLQVKPNAPTPITKAPTAAATKAHIADSIASEKLPLRFSDEPRIFNGEKQMISIDAGGSYSGGWNYGGIVQGSGFNYLVGVGYTRYLKSKLFLKTGLQFNIFGHMNTFSYNYQTALSSHIVNDSVVTTQRLYYLTIPLHVEWFYHGNWSVSLGGTVSYLFGSTGSAISYQQIDNNPPVNIHNYSQNIQLNGYSKITSSVYCMFGYSFNRHFSLRGGMYFDVIPLENKSFFGENVSAVDKGFKAIFSYTL